MSHLPDGFSAYLLSTSDADQAIEGVADLDRFEINIAGSPAGHLYMAQPVDRTPNWYSALKGFMNAVPYELNTRRSKAVWLLPRGTRSIAIPFGDGRFLLNRRKTIANFGLMSVLNAVDAGSIRTLRKRTLDALVPYSRYQASEDTAIDDFGVDVERDLLRGISGRPINTDKWGTQMEGAVALRLHGKIAIIEIPKKLDEIEQLFAEKQYQNSFPWVDYIQFVREDSLVATLSSRVQDVLRDRTKKLGNERCYLALPDTTDLPQPTAYRIGGRSEKLSDLSFVALEMLFGKGTAFDWDFLHTKTLRAVDENDDELKKWQLMECLNFETIHDGARFILIENEWFRVDLSFESQVNRATAQIPTSTRAFPSYAHKNEGAYNKSYTDANPSGLMLFDLQSMHIKHGSGGSSFEFCDLFSSGGELIFVKRFESASKPLSHLFFQALTSARLMRSDRDFRVKVKAKLRDGFSIGDPAAIDPKSFEIVLAVVTSDTDATTDKLPFFSRISLRNVYQRIHNELGFPTTIAWIPTIANVTISV
jgi:uncharacterized protein (TIGR04141 family)